MTAPVARRLSLVLMWLADQPGVIAPVDIRSNRLEEATGTSWRVFAVATDRRIGPVGNNCVASHVRVPDPT